MRNDTSWHRRRWRSGAALATLLAWLPGAAAQAHEHYKRRTPLEDRDATTKLLGPILDPQNAPEIKPLERKGMEAANGFLAMQRAALQAMRVPNGDQIKNQGVHCANDEKQGNPGCFWDETFPNQQLVGLVEDAIFNDPIKRSRLWEGAIYCSAIINERDKVSVRWIVFVKQHEDVGIKDSTNSGRTPPGRHK